MLLSLFKLQIFLLEVFSSCSGVTRGEGFLYFGLFTSSTADGVHGLACRTACGIFPDEEFSLCPLHWQVDSEPLGP